MRYTIGALLGALFFSLAYAYYTVAGLSSGPDGGRALLEFGTVIGLVILLATVLGACLAPPPKAPVTVAEPPRPGRPADQ